MEVAGPAHRSSAGVAALVPLLGLLWGLNWVAVRLCLNEISPWSLRVAGFAVGAAALFAFLLVRGIPLAVPRRHWLRLLAVGVLSVTAYNMLSAFAQLSATTTRSAVLSYTMPIWAVILARLFLGEAIDIRRSLGLALAVCGLLALGWPIFAAGQFTWGLVWALMSGMCWAAGSTFLKRFPIDASPLTMASWQLALATPVTVVGMLVFEGLPQWRGLSQVTVGAFVYHAILAQAVATALWFVILGGLPAGVAAIGSLLVPAVGVIGAMTLIGERPTWGDLLGLVLIVSASAVVLLRFERARGASSR